MNLRELSRSLARVLQRSILGPGRQRRWSRAKAEGAQFVAVKRSLHWLLCMSDEEISREIFVQGLHEFRTFEKVLKISGLSQVSLLIDVGANIGEISLTAISRRLAARAVAIEPDSLNYELLKINAGLNAISQPDELQIHRVAAGTGSPQYLQMLKSANNYGDHQILSGRQESDTSPTMLDRIRNCRIDDLVDADSVLGALLWIDVQGYETQVLAGASNLLRRGIGLVVEVSPRHLEVHSSLNSLLDLVKHYEGYYDLHLHNPRLQSWDKFAARYENLLRANRHTDVFIPSFAAVI